MLNEQKHFKNRQDFFFMRVLNSNFDENHKLHVNY